MVMGGGRGISCEHGNKFLGSINEGKLFGLGEQILAYQKVCAHWSSFLNLTLI
jgi:hypothetical protein